MDLSTEHLIHRVLSGDARAIARVITLIENRAARAGQLVSQLFFYTGRAHIVGVTGSPGAGKSTLVNELARVWVAERKKVAVLAIDPSSPFSGGAILGDRIRMMRAEQEKGVYIRSMATRGALGGTSRATLEAVHVLDAAGFDIIIVETVGVGQAEVDIVRIADTSVVVLVPGMGDGVQTIKAGILEIGDLFVINKSDREGADTLQRDLRVMLSLGDDDGQVPGAWKPEIIQTTATKGEGVEELVKAIHKHEDWYIDSPEGEERKIKLLEEAILKLATEALADKVLRKKDLLRKLAEKCLNKEIDPAAAVRKLLSQSN